MKDILDNKHWKVEDYYQRMRQSDWREMLLSYEDSVTFKGSVRKLKARDIGHGVVEVFKEPLKTEEDIKENIKELEAHGIDKIEKNNLDNEELIDKEKQSIRVLNYVATFEDNINSENVWSILHHGIEKFIDKDRRQLVTINSSKNPKRIEY